jgi:hypothetical protein
MPDTFTKRQKSRDRQDRQREKAAKRAQKKQTEVGRPATADGEDPDIAGIVPGPQPLPEEF